MKDNYGYEIIDPGHLYDLYSLDGEMEQELQFVKRIDDDPTKFPFNDTSYPGATCQFVIRVLLDRVKYLNSQKPCIENQIIIHNLRNALFQFEKRAARRHGRQYSHSPEYAEVSTVCSKCGHTECEHGS